ncbi:MAG: hypothetical protein QM765_13925 [Myxococcales bacterium]
MIQDEAAKRGVVLARNTAPLFGPTVEIRRPPLPETTAAPFAPDLADTRRSIAVEFISRRDADDHGEADGMRYASAHRIQTARAARELASTVQKDGSQRLYFGTMYDPAGHVDPDPDADSWDAARLRAFAANEEHLRAQVRDFLDWLQAQGAL